MVEFIELVRKRAGRTELVQLLEYLEEYAKVHFSSEERIMAENECPTAEQNVREHRSFIEKLQLFKGELSSQGPSHELASRVHKELYLWFIGHIARVDKALAQFVDHEPALKITKSIELEEDFHTLGVGDEEKSIWRKPGQIIARCNNKEESNKKNTNSALTYENKQLSFYVLRR